MPTRKRELSPDAKGRYRPYVGWKIGEDGSRKQHRFNLGTDRREAEKRLSRLRELYEQNCKVNGEDVWSPLALSYAEEIARGKFEIAYPPISPDVPVEDPRLEYAQMIRVDNSRFPAVRIIPADQSLWKDSVALNEEYTRARISDLEAELRELGAIDTKEALPSRLIPGTLYEAWDKYAESIRSHNVQPGTNLLTQYGLLRIERVSRFKEHHDAIPLHSLTYDACTSMIAYWRNRPPARNTGKPVSWDHSRHAIGELMRFFRWLDNTEHFSWQMPKGHDRVKRRIPKTENERRISSITISVYSVEELAVLNQHATPIERLMLYLGLNCAMGAAEMGRLRTTDIIFERKHEHADRLHFDSLKGDSFIRYLRPKTLVFGEWLLWEETAEMVKWGSHRAGKIGSEVIFCSDNGPPWYNDASCKNPQSRFSNAWKRLIARVQKSKPDFRRLPFGTLRDTLPDLLRHKYDNDVASLALAHGTPSNGDSLLDCYGNKPFGRLHTAIREMRQHFEPMFAAAPADSTSIQKTYLSLATHQKIKEMVESGDSTAAIAEECGVSQMTVLRERRRKDE